jgi:hypothetical protein
MSMAATFSLSNAWLHGSDGLVVEPFSSKETILTPVILFSFAQNQTPARRHPNSSTHQSMLSMVAAPSKKRGILKPLLYGVLGAFCLVLVPLKGQAWNILFVVYCVAVVIYLLAALLHNLRGYPAALRRWESSFMCQRCGAIIEPQASVASQGS